MNLLDKLFNYRVFMGLILKMFNMSVSIKYNKAYFIHTRIPAFALVSKESIIN